MLKVFAASALATTLFAGLPAMAETNPLPHILSLTGHGEAKMTPDLAIVDLGTLSQAATAKAALEANTKNMTALMAVLKAAGIDEKDIQTSNFSVGPRYEYNSSQSPKLVGYDVSNSLTVTVKKIDDLGSILDKAVTAGSNQINGITFSVADPQAQQDDARKAAVKDALRKAALLTEAAGTKLGPIVTMTETGMNMPVPTPMVMKAARGSMMADSAPVPVAQGQMTISADVNITWELQP